MSDHQPFTSLVKVCESCQSKMPTRSVRSFVDDGVTYYVCRDDQACEARRAAAGKTLTLTEEMEDAYKRATGVNWSRLHMNHRAGLQAVLDVAARQGLWAQRDAPTGYNLHLLHLAERLRLLEAWRHGVELSAKPKPKRPGLNWDAAGEDDPA